MANYANFGYIETECPNTVPFFLLLSVDRPKGLSPEIMHYCELLFNNIYRRESIIMRSITHLYSMRLHRGESGKIMPYTGIHIDCDPSCWDIIFKFNLRSSMLKKLMNDLPGESVLRAMAAEECAERGLKFQAKAVPTDILDCSHCRSKAQSRAV